MNNENQSERASGGHRLSVIAAGGVLGTLAIGVADILDRYIPHGEVTDSKYWVGMALGAGAAALMQKDRD